MNYTTELPHPKTLHLSQIYNSDIKAGMELLLSIEEDLLAPFAKFENFARSSLLEAIGGRSVILLGSGSSGRIAKIISHRFHQSRGYIAGGDPSLIKPQEGFEDSEKDGAEFVQSHCSKEDILFLISASGSARFNYGAAKEACRLGAKSYYFYNNENEPPVLQEIIKAGIVAPLKFVSGPQAITGSTRLQAANLALLCLGSLFSEPCSNLLSSNLKHVKRVLLSREFLKLYEEIEKILNKNEFVTYITNSDLFLTIFADIAELSPTFGESAISSEGSPGPDARLRAYLKNSDAIPAQVKNYKLVIDSEEIKRRPGIFIEIDSDYQNIYFKSQDTTFTFPKFQLSNSLKILDLYNLKLILNLISNSLMIRNKKVNGNIMTYVKPSNIKLKNRAHNILKNLLIQENREDLIDQIPQILDEIYAQENYISPVPLAFLMLTKNLQLPEAIRLVSGN
jgi:N-acetylmuramic acid 6-phosphate etherase